MNNLYHHKIFDFDVKICDALRINNLGFSGILKVSNLTECPIKKVNFESHTFKWVDVAKCVVFF